MELSKRLFMTASMVERGSIVADVGCDHGYTAIYLVQNGICPRVLAMDVNEGPLARAREHIREAGLSAYIETRLSDGLSAMQWVEEGRPEADTLLMAGIGGRLAARILEDAAQKLFRMRTVIVQPQSELWLVRRTLNRLGYRIAAEDMVKEDGKFYTAILARNMRMPCRNDTEPVSAYAEGAPAMPEGLPLTEEAWREAGENYGYTLISGRHPVLLEYLRDALQKNSAARAAILAGTHMAVHAGEDTGIPGEATCGNDCPDVVSQRSRERLKQLEREALLAEKIAVWITDGQRK
mgnify:CR=1 FL=1